MKADKILTIIVTIAIIGYLIIKMLPELTTDIGEAKKVINETTNTYNNAKLLNYIESKPDYYFDYEGAVYCIPVINLINEGVYSSTDFENTTDIIEANYYDSEYHFKINNDCLER